jgi:replicative DNA helicase
LSEPKYRPVADLLDGWRDDVLSGTPPTLYPVGDGPLGRLEVGPGLVTLFGGAPGAGKTALVMQLACEALARTPELRALVLNVEMNSGTLLNRQLARLSGIDLALIRHRRLGPEHGAAVERGLTALDAIADRLAFVAPPYTLENVAASADDFGADLILLDYIQRIAPPGEHGDRRGAVDAVMTYLRQFADAGTALIVVAALSRTKDAKGRSSYSGEGLSLASFRETSELEYGADDAFILTFADGDEPDDGVPSPRVVLRHLKSRHGETRDMPLTFDRPHQRFTPAEPGGKPAPGDKGRLQATLRQAWARATPADEDDDP